MAPALRSASRSTPSSRDAPLHPNRSSFVSFLFFVLFLFSSLITQRYLTLFCFSFKVNWIGSFSRAVIPTGWNRAPHDEALVFKKNVNSLKLTLSLKESTWTDWNCVLYNEVQVSWIGRSSRVFDCNRWESCPFWTSSRQSVSMSWNLTFLLIRCDCRAGSMR